MKLDLTPFRQETEYTCLPACVRTVMAYYGLCRPEEEIARVCGTNFAGTVFASALDGVRRLGLQVVRLEGGTFDDLLSYLAQGLPVIAGVSAEVLRSTARGGHTVVVHGIEKGEFLYLDPASGEREQAQAERFLEAWRQRRGLGLVILRPAGSREERLNRTGG